jgi:hypothetical protein
VRDAMRASSELYIFNFAMAEHPVLAAIKGGGAKIDRKTVVYFTSDGVATAIEPKSVREALKSLQADQWINAIAVEVDNLRSHSAFHLVPRSEPLSKGKKIMRLTFVFKIKVHADRSLEKFKARLCVVGTGQVQGQDFWESYSSTARTTSVKLILIITAVEGWIDFHFDINGAFLNADIDADVYTEQAPGQEPETGPNGEAMVWKLDKAIYGTVQAARLFRAKFRAFLLSIGFEESMDDDNVYRLDHELGRVVLATHVDDGVGGASSQEVLDWLYAKIRDGGFSFSTPPGHWRSILGFGITRNHAERSVTISCEKHILALAEEHLAADAVHLAPETPDDANIMSLTPPPAETDQEAALLEPMRKRARSLVGGLVYISQVQPAIAHALARCCTLMAKPTAEMYAAAKRILSWLAVRATLGVTYGGHGIRGLQDLLPRGEPLRPMEPQRDASLSCCSDSDLASATLPKATIDEAVASPPDRASSRSQLGYVVMIAHGCLHASSARQQSVALDTPAAETQAASVAASHLLHITGVLRFMSFGVLGHDPVTIWCDNEVTVMVSKDASPIKRLAYVARRVRLLQELDAHGLIKLRRVPGTANPADAMTKHLRRLEYQDYMRVLYNCARESMRAGKRPRYASARGGVTP